MGWREELLSTEALEQKTPASFYKWHSNKVHLEYSSYYKALKLIMHSAFKGHLQTKHRGARLWKKNLCSFTTDIWKAKLIILSLKSSRQLLISLEVKRNYTELGSCSPPSDRQHNDHIHCKAHGLPVTALYAPCERGRKRAGERKREEGRKDGRPTLFPFKCMKM